MKLYTKGLWEESIASIRERGRRTKLYKAWRKARARRARQQRKWNQQHR